MIVSILLLGVMILSILKIDAYADDDDDILPSA